MKILLIAIGSRGDCEPFLGVAELLKQRGEEVLCAFPEQFRALAESTGVPFFSLGTEFLDLMESDVERLAMGGPGTFLKKTKALFDYSTKSLPIQKNMLDLQHDIIERERPNRILYNIAVTYPLPWSMKTGNKSLILSAIPCVLHEVENRAHAGFNGDRGTIINKLSYQLATFGFIQSIFMAVRKYFKEQGFSYKRIKQELLEQTILYAVSPTLFPRPSYWRKNAMVVGFQERNKIANWSPDPEVQAFLDRYDKILFITFGSMTNTDPQGHARMFIDILEAGNIPAIINVAGGGFAPPDVNYNREWIQFVPSLPYDWTFPKMYAVIHHGGAGTTHSALKGGCASMAIPHTADQPMWDDVIHELGAGPKGIPIGKLTKKSLKAKMLDLYQNPTYKANAEKISAHMQQEDFSDELYWLIVK